MAKSDSEGNFTSCFVTYGSLEKIRSPSIIVAFIKTGIGKWEPLEVKISDRNIKIISAYEMSLYDLKVELPTSILPYKNTQYNNPVENYKSQLKSRLYLCSPLAPDLRNKRNY